FYWQSRREATKVSKHLICWSRFLHRAEPVSRSCFIGVFANMLREVAQKSRAVLAYSTARICSKGSDLVPGGSTDPSCRSTPALAAARWLSGSTTNRSSNRSDWVHL